MPPVENGRYFCWQDMQQAIAYVPWETGGRIWEKRRMAYFFQGLLLGLAYVAPIGLQNLFVINSALTCSGRQVLFTAGMVIFFDITLALSCFFGIGAMMQDNGWFQMAVLLAGSCIVIYMGTGPKRGKAEARCLRFPGGSPCILPAL